MEIKVKMAGLGSGNVTQWRMKEVKNSVVDVRSLGF